MSEGDGSVGGMGDLGCLDAEVGERGIDEVIADLRARIGACDREEGEALGRVARVLDLESHALRGWAPARNPSFFLQQVRNRAFEIGLDDLAAQAETILLQRRLPYLRERRRTGHASEALVRTMEGSEARVVDVAAAPDGGLVVSASHGGTIEVWEVGTGRLVRTLTGPGELQGVNVTGDGRFVVSAHREACHVWDLRTGLTVREAKTAAALSVTLAVSPDGHRALLSSLDGAQLWDLDGGEQIRVLTLATDAHVDVAPSRNGRFGILVRRDITWMPPLSPDSRRKSYGHVSKIASFAVWDMNRVEVVRTFWAALEEVGMLTFALAEDGASVVVGQRQGLVVLGLDAGGQETRKLCSCDEGDEAQVTAVAVTGDGRLGFTGHVYGEVRVWDLLGGRLLTKLRAHAGWVSAITVTPDDRFAVSSSHDGTLRVWCLSRARESPEHTPPPGRVDPVDVVAVTEDGRAAVSSSAGTFVTWDVREGAPLRSAARDRGPERREVTSIALSASGGIAVAATNEALSIELWDLSRGRLLQARVRGQGSDDEWGYWKGTSPERYRVPGVAITPDGLLAVSACGDGTALLVLDVAQCEVVHLMEGHEEAIHRVAISPDARFAVSASADTTLRVWDLEAGRSIRTLGCPAGIVTDIAISANGRFLLAATKEGVLHVFSLPFGQLVRTARMPWGPGEAKLDGHGRFAFIADRALLAWELETGRLTPKLVTPVRLRSVAVVPGGSTFVAGDALGAVHFLDWITWDEPA